MLRSRRVPSAVRSSASPIDVQRVVGQLVQPAEEPHPDALCRSSSVSSAIAWPSRSNRPATSSCRPRPVLAAEGIQGEHRDGRGGRRAGAGCGWPRRRPRAPRNPRGRGPGPSAVAVHDDRDVPAELLGGSRGASTAGVAASGAPPAPAVSSASGGASVGRDSDRSSGAWATRPPGPPAPSRHRGDRRRRPPGTVIFCSWSRNRRASSAPTVPSRSSFLIASFASASEVADLDPCFFDPLVDGLDDLPATILGERRDVEADDGAVDVRRAGRCRSCGSPSRWRTGRRGPRLDHDRCASGDADPGQLVERGLRAVVVDGRSARRCDVEARPVRSPGSRAPSPRPRAASSRSAPRGSRASSVTPPPGGDQGTDRLAGGDRRMLSAASCRRRRSAGRCPSPG